MKKYKTTHNVGESTVRFFKMKYLEILKGQEVPGMEAKSVPVRKRGKKVLLGAQVDAEVQSYVNALRSAGAPIGSSVVMAAAHGHTTLVENGGHISMLKTWAISLLKRMGYVKQKANTKSTPEMSGERFEQVKAQFLNQIARMVHLSDIPQNLVINLDQTGIHLVRTGEWTMAVEGSKRVEMVALGYKRQVTATFAACLDGTFLPMQVLYQGKTARCHPKYCFPVGFDIFHTPNHWANEETCLWFFETIIFPYIQHTREAMGAPSQKALIIMDNFSGQTTPAVLDEIEKQGIILVMVPPGTTDRLTPLDISTNKSAKEFLRAKFRQWYADEVQKQLQAGVEAVAVNVNTGMPVMKEAGAKWLTSLYHKLSNERDIVINGFRKVGIINAIKQTLPSN